MSSSGPLAWAWSYGKPALLSEALAAYAHTPDLATALTQVGLTADDITYEDDAGSLQQALDRVQQNEGAFGQLAEAMARSRSREKVAAATLAVVMGV